MTARLFTSESVTEGHPDKIADAISDTVLDYLLAHDDNPADLRVAVETLLTTGLVVVAGEVRTSAYAPVADLVRAKVLEIGYDSSDKGFDGASCGVQVASSPSKTQSNDRGTPPTVNASVEVSTPAPVGDQVRATTSGVASLRKAPGAGLTNST